MNHLHTILRLAAVFLTTAICAQATKPNVIVILADDLGYADLGCQGSPDVKTPHIDSIAKNGVRFTNGYVSSPQCGPSRAGLLTGRYQNRFGFESNEFASRSIPTSEKLISERMKEAGYATGYVGKWGVGNKRASGLEFLPPQRGFDESYWNAGGNFHYSATPGGHDVQFYRGQWKGKIPAGMVYEKPIISLDILPTALAAPGVEINPEWKLDGVNLLPFLSEKITEAPHDTLYCRFKQRTDQPDRNRWAIRQADWMLLCNHAGHFPVSLYDISKDPEQKRNLADAHPERVFEMRKQWETWNSEHPELPVNQYGKQPFGGQQRAQPVNDEEQPGAILMPEIFSNDMILQREVPVPVWGSAPDGTVVTVAFNGDEHKTTAADGTWKVTLPPMKASAKPAGMTISARSGATVETRRFTNILVGDVWFASGQSNMEMRLSEAKGGREAVAASDNPSLRHFIVPRPDTPAAGKPSTGWMVSSPDTTAKQSAVGYFFASELQRELGIPIGLLNCSYGGTVTETWCGPEVMSKNWPAWSRWQQSAINNPKVHARNSNASYLYERMVKPLTPFPVKGFIWYQGEGNASRAEEQKTLLPAMIRDWRRSWGNERLPFFFVQLARYEAADWHAFRCAQLEVWENTPDTFMAVTIDLSKEPGNHPIHPKAKAQIGHRLALAARAKVYGETDLVYSGPIIREAKFNGDSVVLSFDHVGSGLATLDGKPVRGFYLSAGGGKFTAADAVIEGETVVLHHPDVPQPIAVRYGAEADMGKEELDLNLANREMLPASPFTVTSTETQ